MAAALIALPRLAKLATSPTAWACVAGAGMAVAIGVQTWRLDNAKADQIDPKTHAAWKTEELADHPQLVVARQDLGTCQTNEGTLTGALASQNAAVAALKAEGDRRTAAAASAVSAARTAAQAASQRLATVMAAKAGPDACASADQLILGSTAP